MALIKCKECGNDVSDEAIICPSCGLLFRAPEIPVSEKKKRKPRAPSTSKPKPQVVSRNWAIFQITGIGAGALILIGILVSGDSLKLGPTIEPVAPVILRKYTSDERSSALDVRTTVFAVVKNNGGNGRAKVEFAVYQGKKSYNRDTIVTLSQGETSEYNMTFSEVRLIDGNISFNATVKPL